MRKYWQRIMALIMVAALLVQPINGEEAKSEQSYSLKQDTFIDGRNVDKNQSLNRELIIKWAGNPDYRREGFMQFDLATVANEIEKATLHFTITKADNGPGKIDIAGFSKNDWQAADLTFSTYYPD